MRTIIKTLPSLFFLLLFSGASQAQRFADFYSASTANLLTLNGNKSIEQTIKGATVILPNGSQNLLVNLQLPSGTINGVKGNLSFQLTMIVDPQKIQDALTSEVQFVTQGSLTFNGITAPVLVTYQPRVSGTEENGGFTIYMSIQFNAADFNLGKRGDVTGYVLRLAGAKVNRV